MITLKRALRPALALLALGPLALTACAPTQSVQVSAVQLPADQTLSPYDTRSDAATLVFRSETARSGAVDLLVGGAPILRQIRFTDSYRVVLLPPGRQTLTVRNSLSGLVLEALTVDLDAGESYALKFDAIRSNDQGIEYRLLLGQGSNAVSDLVY